MKSRIALLLPAMLACVIAFSCMDRNAPAEDGSVRVVLPGSSRGVSGMANADSYTVSLIKDGKNIESQTAQPGGAVEFDGLDAGDYTVDVEATLSGDLSGVGSSDVYVAEGETSQCSVLMSRVYTAATAAEYIESLEAGSYKVIVAGAIDDSKIEGIKDALKLKKAEPPLVTLDLSRTTGLTELPASAFSGCTTLAGIKLPSTVTSILGYSFESCSALESVEIPSSVTSISSSVFYKCTSLKSIELPNRITSIGSNVFESCSALESIVLSDNMIGIGSSAFKGCTNLVSIVIPKNITAINFYTFYGCTSLKDVTLPSGITEIGADAFENCTNLASIVLPDSIDLIGVSAFKGCENLASVVLPSKITQIDSQTFSNCKNLESIVLPDRVETINTNAFDSCNKLMKITIPVSVTSIKSNAFLLCSNLQIVCYKGSKTQWDNNVIPNIATTGNTKLTDGSITLSCELGD